MDEKQKKDSNFNSSISEQQTEKPSSSYSNTSNTTDNNNSMNNSNTSSSDDNPNQNISSSLESNSTTTKTSSKSNPLSIGEWGYASKYSSKKYIDVPVKVTNVTRGNSAAEQFKEYCNSDFSIYKYENAQSDMEWVIVDYAIDFTNNDVSSFYLDSKIIGTGNGNSIKYNGKTYIISTYNMTTKNSNENPAKAKFATQLPIGCTDYLIVLGSSSNTQAFFAGK